MKVHIKIWGTMGAAGEMVKNSCMVKSVRQAGSLGHSFSAGLEGLAAGLPGFMGGKVLRPRSHGGFANDDIEAATERQWEQARGRGCGWPKDRGCRMGFGRPSFG